MKLMQIFNIMSYQKQMTHQSQFQHQRYYLLLINYQRQAYLFQIILFLKLKNLSESLRFNATQQMYSQIVQKTPSIYFKFDDSYQKHNFSKSSLAFQYSISNQKFSQNRNPNIGVGAGSTKNRNLCISKRKQQFRVAPFISHEQEDLLSGISSKLKTEEFFQDFQNNFVVTFEEEDHIFGSTNDIGCEQLFTSDQYLQGKGPSSILNFDFDFDFEQKVKMIHIQSRKSLKVIDHSSYQQQNKQSQQSVSDFIIEQQDLRKQQIKKQSSQKQGQKQRQIIHNLDQQKQKQKYEYEYEQSFLNQNQHEYENQQHQRQDSNLINKSNNSIKTKSIKSINITKSPNIFNINLNFNNLSNNNKNHSIITKDFQNNSSIYQMNPESTKRVPFRSIQNIINNHNNNSKKCGKKDANNTKSTKNIKNAKGSKSQQRKKQIINGDLFISTINKNAWSNPIQRKQPEGFSSLEHCSSWQKKDQNFNLFHTTNAFKQTLKSTTLQNWKKKYHMKNLYQKKTVKRNINIFEKPFMLR